jgi:signal transduction histidine kinase
MSSTPDSLTRTFGLRLALWYFVLFVTGSVLVLALAYALLAWSLRAQDREIIESTLVRYARTYERGGLNALTREIASERQTGRYEPLFVRVLARGESAIFFDMPGDWTGFDAAQLSSPELRGGQRWAEIGAARSAERLEVASARLSDGTLFQIGKSTRTRDEILRRFRGLALLLLGAIVMAGLAGGRMLTWSALRPLRELSRTVESILKTGQTDARVPVPPTRDELADLGTLMNQMLDRIEALIGGMRGALDNVAHDLRTPVTRLRATAETGLREAKSPEAYRDALADCLEEADRVMTMLDALMDIAEAETGALRLTIEDVDVVSVVRDAVNLYADVAEDKQMTIDVEVPERMPAPGDRARLTQAVANLLDNAVKYTAAGGRVRVVVAGGARNVEITVSDTGVGIPADELPQIWDRLFRGDRSRSQRGLGLGLSLVRAIVEAHGGKAEVRSTPGQGSIFTIRLPAPTLTAELCSEPTPN